MNRIPIFGARGVEQYLPMSVAFQAIDAARELAVADGVDPSHAGVHSAMRRLDSMAAANGMDRLSDADIVDAMQSRRQDSAGLYPAGTLTQRVARILATPRAPYDGLDDAVIPQQAFTDPTAENTEIVRINYTGESAPYRDGVNIPLADAESTPELFPLQHYVAGFRISLFQRRSMGNRLINAIQQKTTAVRRAILQPASTRTWQGDTATGLPGVFTHPWIPRRIGAVVYQDAVSGEAILNDLFDLVDYPANQSADVGRVTRLVLASKLHRYLSGRQVNSAAGNKTILTAFREARPEIDVRMAHSLNDAGPNGEDGMFAFDASDPDCCFRDIPQGITALAPQTQEFADLMFFYMTDAGLKAFNTDSCLLQWTARSA